MIQPTECRTGNFPMTSWRLLRTAIGTGETALAARAEFAERYYRPVLAYLIAMVRDRDQAEDLCQGFFAEKVIPGGIFAAQNRGPESFRTFLKGALRNFFRDVLRKKKATKRPPSDLAVRPDGDSRGWERIPRAAAGEAERAFDQAFIRSLLATATRRVAEICAEKDQGVHFELFRQRYLGSSDEVPSWRRIGAAFGLGEKDARARTLTVARHFQQVLKDLVSEGAARGRSPEDEIRSLLSALAKE